MRVIGSHPVDWTPPARDKRPPSRALTVEEVELMRRAVEYVKDVGWRPFGAEGKAWQAALDWAIGEMDRIISETHKRAKKSDTPASPRSDRARRSAVLKTAERKLRGFESHPLRQAFHAQDAASDHQ